jgi:hypothetical protein
MMKLDPEEPVTEESLAAFSVKFNVRRGRRNYKKFIETLRRKVGGNFSHNLPVLHDQNLSTQRFHVVLENNDKEITLSIQRENLYLVGYKTQDSTSWLELGKDTTDPPSPHQILGSTFLGFSGHYQDLERAAQVKSRDEIHLGQRSLIHAICNLQNSIELKASGKTKAHALIIMIRMICESMRFVKISDHIAKNYFLGFIPENWMVGLEVRWGRISRDLLSLDMNHNHRFQIMTVHEATTVLGVLLFKLDGFQSMVDVERTQKQPLAEVLLV